MYKVKIGVLKWSEVYQYIYSSDENEDVNTCMFCGYSTSNDVICPLCNDNLY